MQNDPLSTLGNTGRKSLWEDHAAFILGKCEAGLSAQRIYQNLRVEVAFSGLYQSLMRYVRRLRRTDPKLVTRIEMEPGLLVNSKPSTLLGLETSTAPVVT